MFFPIKRGRANVSLLNVKPLGLNSSSKMSSCVDSIR